MSDEDRTADLAEDRLWRLRSGMPGPFEMDARAIVEKNPQVAAFLGLDRFLDGVPPLAAVELTDAELTAIGQALLAERDDGEVPPDLLAGLQRVAAAFDQVAGAEPLRPPTTLADLQAAIGAGEPCSRLVEIKNAMDPKSPELQRAVEALRAVGCYSASSTRTDH
jgi:hypothetical protein